MIAFYNTVYRQLTGNDQVSFDAETVKAHFIQADILEKHQYVTATCNVWCKEIVCAELMMSANAF